MKEKHILRFMGTLAMTLAAVGCARMGSPDGGWYDETPPRVIATEPQERGVNVDKQKIIIYFNEYINVEDATSNVVISPPQIEPAEIEGAGKKVEVELKDTLKENTTYTIDFSDAIEDNNESNAMGNYTFTFSTGPEIDTLEIAGTVLDASNLEPVKSILVGLYANLSDTAFTSEPFLRVARTDSRGHFIIRGIAPGDYRIYALNDADGDYIYNQKSEMLSFNHEIITPTSGLDTRQDTIWRDSLHIDSIVKVKYTHFYPDNVVLRAFTATQTDRYLIKTERQDADRLRFYFTYGDTILPKIRGLNFNSDSAFVVEPSEEGDTIVYWIRDTALVNTDSLIIEAQYTMTDTTGVIITQTDTLEMIPKMPYEKRKKAEEKEFEEWQKAEEKKKKKGEPYDSIRPPKKLEVDMGKNTTLDPDKNITMTFPVPLARCDTQALHLYCMIDSLWYRSRFEVKPIPGKLRQLLFRAEWRPGIEYSLEVDSAAFEDIYGHVSNAIKLGLKVRTEDEYGTLMVNVSGINSDGDVYVQILNASDAVMKTSKVVDGTADFFYMPTGDFYMRAFIDLNGNGEWDTGDYYADLQPEEVFYYEKKVELKAKWDITLSWDLRRLPLNKQKPGEITKQKPDQDKKKKNRNEERAKELGIEYVKDNIND